MSIDRFLGGLEKVRRTGPTTWIACCPAHVDKTPSLSVRDDAGKVLIHCFGGCNVEDVFSSVGMQLTDLFPDSRAFDERKRVTRNRVPAGDILAMLAVEAQIVCVAAMDIRRGLVPTEESMERLARANDRIRTAMEVVSGR